MNKAKILRMLKNSDGFVSGEIFCKELNISRQAIWKNINSLKKDGYDIESVKGKGYILRSDEGILGSAGITSLLEGKAIRYRIEYTESIDSTNKALIKKAYTTDAENMVLIADHQTSGLGRRGRSFYSPAKESIYMSILLRPKIDPGSVSCITLVAAMAVCKALKKSLNKSGYKEAAKRIGIKWPNDIWIGEKKLCGILTQMSCESDYITYVVTGIGINVNNKVFSDELKSIATSLFMETNQNFDRQSIIADILEAFAEYYDIFLADKSMKSLMVDYDDNLINKSKEVLVYGGLVEEIEPDSVRRGKARGIDIDGALLVDMYDTKKTERIIAGEVSIRNT